MVEPFRILCLDGGGAKGVFTLGVLKQLENEIGGPLNKHFDLVYGTSTGAIIAAFLCLGFKVDNIYEKYIEIVPNVFSKATNRARHSALRKHATENFGAYGFEDFEPLIGIISSDCDHKRPRTFKSEASQSFTRKGGFLPGFGATVEEALLASSAAIPILPPMAVNTKNQGCPELVDGGFVANNPSLFAITDAIGGLGVKEEAIRLLSIGTGNFSSPFRWRDAVLKKMLGAFVYVQQVFSALDANANATHLLVLNLFPKMNYVRVNDANTSIYCDLKTTNLSELEKAYTFGGDVFGKFEKEILDLF